MIPCGQVKVSDRQGRLRYNFLVYILIKLDVRCVPLLIDCVKFMALSGASTSAVSGQVSMNIDHIEKRILSEASLQFADEYYDLA